jgi:predicted NAD/FAD-dependent oxidoreductase
MSDIAGYLAGGLEVRSGVRAASISFSGGQWKVRTDAGIFEADSLALTPPVPQSLELLHAGGVDLPGHALRALESIVYEPCIAVLALLDGASRIPPPGGLRLAGEPLSWIADNSLKGISHQAGAVVVHAGAAFSRERLEEDLEETGKMILDAASPWLGTRVKTVQVHRWRYSKPSVLHRERCLVVREPGILVFAGDAFGGPRVEGAALSGLAAAEKLIETRRAP